MLPARRDTYLSHHMKPIHHIPAGATLPLMSIRAKVSSGRIIVDQPTLLPEGRSHREKVGTAVGTDAVGTGTRMRNTLQRPRVSRRPA